jgi:hypothetical protein
VGWQAINIICTFNINKRKKKIKNKKTNKKEKKE